MKNRFNNCTRLLAMLLCLVTIAASLAACDKEPEEPGVTHEDFVSNLTLDMSTSSAKQEVTVKTYIDGDTTHFNFPGFDGSDTPDVLKARYISINTPESTGTIEEWGKKASNFTKEALKNAVSIIIESDTDDGKWNADSTGDRHLVWVWYKTAEDQPYRNLNLEILQNGLAIASNSGGNRYGEICLSAIAQAKDEKLYVFSGKKDPDFYYGAAHEVTLRELRTNLDKYKDQKVAFEATVSRVYDNAAYVEALDEESGIIFGMYVYYGFGLRGKGLQMITTIGNRIRIVGSVQYWETGESYQISNLSYDPMIPNDPTNLRLISQDNPIPYTLTTVEQFHSKIELMVGAEGEEEKKEFSYSELILGSTISMQNLKVVDVYTTKDGASAGAMTITCQDASGREIDIRTIVLKDENGGVYGEQSFLGKTLDVRGVVDAYGGEQQIKVFSMSAFTFHDAP